MISCLCRSFNFALTLAVAVSAWAAGTETPLPRNQPLSPGTRLHLNSNSEALLNDVIEVEWDGHAKVPLCGTIKLAGLEISAALESLNVCTAKFFKKPPDISIAEILPRLSAVKVGERGQKPQFVKTVQGTSVNSLLASAGLTLSAQHTLRVLSPRGLDLVDKADSLEWNRSFNWLGGEHVIYEKSEPNKSSFFIDILGEVRKPGKLDYRPSASLLDVIREAQGPTPQAAHDTVIVFRGLSGKKIETNWDDTKLRIEPGDTILLPAQRESNFERGLRWTGSILAIINTFFLVLLARKG
ncbi:hypothetical protein EBU99_05815 [bacterium]|nr:hypothetical protein [bacterium]